MKFVHASEPEYAFARWILIRLGKPPERFGRSTPASPVTACRYLHELVHLLAAAIVDDCDTSVKGAMKTNRIAV